jgi:hypothetical protein
MSDNYVVKEVETVDSTSSTSLVVLVIAIIALAVIGLAFWQPWAVSPAAVPSNSTTVIKESHTEQQAPANPAPVIVNPPASSAPAQGSTKVEINNNGAPAGTSSTTGQ